MEDTVQNARKAIRQMYDEAHTESDYHRGLKAGYLESLQMLDTISSLDTAKAEADADAKAEAEMPKPVRKRKATNSQGE